MNTPRYKRTVIACYIGYIMQAIVNNLSPLFFTIFQRDYRISLSALGTLILFNFGIQLLVDITMSKLGDRFSYRFLIVSAHICGTVGLCLLGILPRIMSPYPALLIATGLCAVGGGLAEVVVSPMVDALPSDCKEASMSLLHSFYCWGQVATVVLSTLLLSLIGDAYWWILPIIWAVIPFLNTINFLTVPLVQGVPEGTKKTPLSELIKQKAFLLSMIIMVCGGATELIMAQWSSLFAEAGLGISKVTGDLLGPALFAVFMGLGRTYYGIRGNKINLRHALCLCAGFGVFTYLCAALIPSPFLSLVACALSGFAASLMWPGTLSFTSAKYPGGGTSMFALLAFCGDIGCSLGPWLTGLVSDAGVNSSVLIDLASRFEIGKEAACLRLGILVGTAFPLLMFLLLAIGKHEKKPSKQ